jgi:hypothetical protein
LPELVDTCCTIFSEIFLAKNGKNENFNQHTKMLNQSFKMLIKIKILKIFILKIKMLVQHFFKWKISKNRILIHRREISKKTQMDQLLKFALVVDHYIYQQNEKCWERQVTQKTEHVTCPLLEIWIGVIGVILGGGVEKEGGDRGSQWRSRWRGEQHDARAGAPPGGCR